MPGKLFLLHVGTGQRLTPDLQARARNRKSALSRSLFLANWTVAHAPPRKTLRETFHASTERFRIL